MAPDLPKGMRFRKGIYTGRFRGREKSFGRNRRIAIQAYREWRDLIDKERFGLGSYERQLDPLDRLLEDYVAELGIDRTARHVEETRRGIERILSQTRARTAADLNYEVIGRWRRTWSKSLAPRTLNFYTGALNAMLRWGVRSGYLAVNPLEHLKQLEQKGREVCVRRALTIEEGRRFMEAARAMDAEKRATVKRWRVSQVPLFLALLDTGARVGELFKLTWGDRQAVDGAPGLRIQASYSRKNPDSRSVPIGVELADELDKLRRANTAVLGRLPGPRDRIFLSPLGLAWTDHGRGRVRRWFDDLIGRAGIKKVTDEGKVDVHALRHTAVQWMQARGVPLEVASAMVGHRDLNITRSVYGSDEQMAKSKRAAKQDTPRLLEDGERRGKWEA